MITKEEVENILTKLHVRSAQLKQLHDFIYAWLDQIQEPTWDLEEFMNCWEEMQSDYRQTLLSLMVSTAAEMLDVTELRTADWQLRKITTIPVSNESTQLDLPATQIDENRNPSEPEVSGSSSEETPNNPKVVSAKLSKPKHVTPGSLSNGELGLIGHMIDQPELTFLNPEFMRTWIEARQANGSQGDKIFLLAGPGHRSIYLWESGVFNRTALQLLISRVDSVGIATLSCDAPNRSPQIRALQHKIVQHEFHVPSLISWVLDVLRKTMDYYFPEMEFNRVISFESHLLEPLIGFFEGQGAPTVTALKNFLEAMCTAHAHFHISLRKYLAQIIWILKYGYPANSLPDSRTENLIRHLRRLHPLFVVQMLTDLLSSWDLKQIEIPGYFTQCEARRILNALPPSNQLDQPGTLVDLAMNVYGVSRRDGLQNQSYERGDPQLQEEKMHSLPIIIEGSLSSVLVDDVMRTSIWLLVGMAIATRQTDDLERDAFNAILNAGIGSDEAEMILTTADLLHSQKQWSGRKLHALFLQWGNTLPTFETIAVLTMDQA